MINVPRPKTIRYIKNNDLYESTNYGISFDFVLGNNSEVLDVDDDCFLCSGGTFFYKEDGQWLEENFSNDYTLVSSTDEDFVLSSIGQLSVFDGNSITSLPTSQTWNPVDITTVNSNIALILEDRSVVFHDRNTIYSTNQFGDHIEEMPGGYIVIDDSDDRSIELFIMEEDQLVGSDTVLGDVVDKSGNKNGFNLITNRSGNFSLVNENIETTPLDITDPEEISFYNEQNKIITNQQGEVYAWY